MEIWGLYFDKSRNVSGYLQLPLRKLFPIPGRTLDGPGFARPGNDHGRSRHRLPSKGRDNQDFDTNGNVGMYTSVENQNL